VNVSGTSSVRNGIASSQRQIFKQLVCLLKEGKIHDLDDPHPRLNGVFAGSADRYAEIAFLLQGHHKVLDVGSGSGMLISILANLGHDCCGLDLTEPEKLPSTYGRPSIEYKLCNAEVDTYPFPDETFDAVTCCQVLEHFSHSPLPALAEMKRVLKPGGVIELDVPNVASFRNRMRLIRGKNITWDYRDHYLHAKPLFHKGHTFYPFRHNREFTKAELAALLAESGFVDIQVRFMKDRNYRTGIKRFLSMGTAARNLIPSIRKSLIAFAKKR
jgi:ubiquinone/menaquinone biosynthesis C-methylase UbiE